MHVQSCCFAQQTYCRFHVLFAVAVVLAKAPYWVSGYVPKTPDEFSTG